MTKQRLYFIDAIRAFAILAMLEGHFIDTFLAPILRDKTSIIYNTWFYIRGNTAPTFFTISGFVFVYLLLQTKTKEALFFRLEKGFKRGLMLIGIGYLLRTNLFSVLTGYFNPYMLVIDVLQCIGVAIILLTGFFYLFHQQKNILKYIWITLALIIFLLEPVFKNISFPEMPLLFENYLSKANGSIFTLIPWLGYSFFGGFFAILFNKEIQRLSLDKIALISMFIGICAIFFSQPLLNALYDFTGIDLFIRSANSNYLLPRLGNVLCISGIFMAFENMFKHQIVLKLGSETLSIYVIHFIMLYGAVIGFGLKSFIPKDLTWLEAGLGALTFMVAVSYLALQQDKILDFLKAKTVKFFSKFNTVIIIPSLKKIRQR